MSTCLLWGYTPLAAGIVMILLTVVNKTLAEAEEVEVSMGAEAWGEGQERSAGVFGERYYDVKEQGEEGHLLGPAQAVYHPYNCLVYLCLKTVMLQCWKNSP